MKTSPIGIADVIVTFSVALVAFIVARLFGQEGYVKSWSIAFITLFFNWLVIFLAVGDQIIRNWRSGRASQQLSWTVFLANIAENFAWVMLGWGVNDPIVVIARIPGLFFDQIVFWQMLWSTAEAQRRGRLFVWLKYAMTPFTVAVIAVAIVPLWFLPQLRGGAMPVLLKYFVSIVWLWTASGWVLQFSKNRKSDILTGRDFSPKIPVLVEFFLASWLFNEFYNGHTGLAMYAINGLALLINSALLVQSLYYVRLWRKVSPEALQMLELMKTGQVVIATDHGCYLDTHEGRSFVTLDGLTDRRALIASGAQGA